MSYKMLFLALMAFTIFLQPIIARGAPGNNSNRQEINALRPTPNACSQPNLKGNLSVLYQTYKEYEKRAKYEGGECNEYMYMLYYYNYMWLKCGCDSGCDDRLVVDYLMNMTYYQERIRRLQMGGECLEASPSTTTTQPAQTGNSDPVLISAWVFPMRGTGNQVYNYSVSLRDPEGDPVMVQLCIYVLDVGWQCFDALTVMGEGTASWNMTYINATPGTYRYRVYYDDGRNRGAWGPYEGPIVGVVASNSQRNSTEGSNDLGVVVIVVILVVGVVAAKKSRVKP